MNVSFISLGCDKNRVNTEQMMALCLQAGITVQEDCPGSDVVVINTCGFIDSAKSEAIDTILSAAQLKEEGQIGKILVTGCLSQRYQADILEELPEIDGIMGTGCFGDIVTALEQVVNGQECRHFADINGPVEELPRVLSTPRQYAYLRIAEGCSNRCAYCVIPRARGPVRSRDEASILDELRRLADAGYKEVVLTAISLPSYGTDSGTSLVELIEKAAEVEGIERIRLGSLDPDMLHDEVITRMAAVKKLCPQFHLSLQSGCDKTLRAMRRPYTTAQFADIAAKLRAAFGAENVSFTTDVIVGFPGETEEDFEASMAFVTGQHFLKVHVFPYSRREGTPAYDFPGQLPEHEKEDRSRRMTAAVEEVRAAEVCAVQGRTASVLLETPLSATLFTGYTKQYLPVLVSAPGHKTGDIVNVMLGAWDGRRCRAEIVEK